MLNIMRSDIYRLVRGKCIYITFALFLYATGVQAYNPGSLTMGIGNNNVPGLENVSGLASGALAPFAMMTNADNIIFFMLSILFVLSATDFSSGSIKNSLSSGISRTKFYFSKLFLGSIFCVLMFISGIVCSVLVSTITNGFGGTITNDYLLSVLRPFAAQLLMLIGAVCIGTAIIFVTKIGAALNAIYIGFFLGMSILLLIFRQMFNLSKDIMFYDFAINLKMLAFIDNMATGDIARALLIGVVCIISSTIFGLLVFSKSEIK